MLSLLTTSMVIPADFTLTWKPQISELSKKLDRTRVIFFRMRHYVILETSKLLYYSLFYSFLFMALLFGA